MYKRKANLEVEDLDWECHISPSLVKKNAAIEKVILSSVHQKNKIPLYENVRLFFIFTLLVLPYIVGFFLSYLVFYVYGNMNMADFLIIQEEYHYIESWGIGMYLLVTGWTVWIVTRSLFASLKK